MLRIPRALLLSLCLSLTLLVITVMCEGPLEIQSTDVYVKIGLGWEWVSWVLVS